MHKEDIFRIDSHKLLFHPHRVSMWLDGQNIAPIYMEISPTGLCNHRCLFCAKDYIGYPSRFLDSDTFSERLLEFSQLGVRSIMYGGEGEPLLHPRIDELIKHTHSVGIDVAMSTNGVFLSAEVSAKILPLMSWLKVSINAGTPAGYASIHRTDASDFSTVLANLTAAATLIRENGWPCTLGAQAILLPDNAAEMEELAVKVRDAGASYLVVKPYSQHPSSHSQMYAHVDYVHYDDVANCLEQCNTENFRVIFRRHTMNKLQCAGRGYDRCLALPFWAYIDSAGDVWGCNSFIGDDRFRYGNINIESFTAIWEGGLRQRSMDFVATELDASACRLNCRMDEINRYLWEIKHPSLHVNFI
jgi:radical SAM protein with 4Fe4S-binding SPASM domain